MLPPPPHNIILFEFDFDVKFHLLRLLQFLIDLKKYYFNDKSIKKEKESMNIIRSNFQLLQPSTSFLGRQAKYTKTINLETNMH